MAVGTNEGSVEFVNVNVPDGFGLDEGKCAASRALMTRLSVARGDDAVVLPEQAGDESEESAVDPLEESEEFAVEDKSD